MDYPCGKFGDCKFQPFWFCRADKHTNTQTPLNDFVVVPKSLFYNPAPIMLIQVQNTYRAYRASAEWVHFAVPTSLLVGRCCFGRGR